MSSLTEFVISLVGGATSAMAIIYWLGSKLVGQRLAKDIEKFKAEITEKTEVLKTELSIYAHEQNVALVRIDAQRSQAVGKIYTAFSAWSNPLSKLVNGCPLMDSDDLNIFKWHINEAEKAHIASKDLLNLIHANAIYLDEDTYNLLFSVITESGYSIAEYLRPLRQAEANVIPIGTALQEIKSIQEALKQHQNEKMVPMYAEITKRFRKIIGVEK